MVRNRREFLAASAWLTLGGARAVRADAQEKDKAEVDFALDLETFWGRSRFNDRLKSMADTGFRKFEFGRFKAKDYLAIGKIARELDLECVGFTAFQGIADPKAKEVFIGSLEDAIEVADSLGAKRLTIGVGEAVKGLDADRQFEVVVEALEAAVEKIKENDIVLAIDPLVRKGAVEKRVVKSLKDALEIVDEVKHERVRLLVDLESGWTIDGAFWDGLVANLAKIGGLRLASARLVPGTKTGGLEPGAVLKQIKELGSAVPSTLELSPKVDPSLAIETLRQARRDSKG